MELERTAPMNMDRYTQQNRRAWNEIAVGRVAKFEPPEFFAHGGSTLGELDLREAGDVRGKRLLNLQCSSGQDALSWAVAGADVTGVNISDTAIEIARNDADVAGLQATFVVADLFDLPSDLQRGDFDFVFSSAGITVWLPDIWEWARIVAAALKPGGKLILSDGHPVRSNLTFVDDGVEVVSDYFARAEPYLCEGGLTLACNAPSSESNYQFHWPLGDIVTALAKAGMRIDYLEEFPGPPAYFQKAAEDIRVPALVERLPAWYQLTATREATQS